MWGIDSGATSKSIKKLRNIQLYSNGKRKNRGWQPVASVCHKFQNPPIVLEFILYSVLTVAILNSDFEKSLWLGYQKFIKFPLYFGTHRGKVCSVYMHKYDDFIDHILKEIINHIEVFHAAVHFTDTAPKLQTTNI